MSSEFSRARPAKRKLQRLKDHQIWVHARAECTVMERSYPNSQMEEETLSFGVYLTGWSVQLSYPLETSFFSYATTCKEKQWLSSHCALQKDHIARKRT
jgi:hypothetical protein